MPQSPMMTVMQRAASKAGRALARDFGEIEQLQVSHKGPDEFIAKATEKAAGILHAELTRARPEFGFVDTDGLLTPGADESQRWLVTPLSGLYNFGHGIPHWAIVVAVELDGEPVAGLIYDPLRDEIFSTEKGGGAFISNRRCRMAASRNPGNCLALVGVIAGEVGETTLRRLARLIKVLGGVNISGCTALDLAHLAAGRADICWHEKPSPAEAAAGIVLTREAGGLAERMPDGNLVTATPSLLAPIIKLLRSADSRAA